MRSLSSAGEPVASVTTSAASGAAPAAGGAPAGPKSYTVFCWVLLPAQPASSAAPARARMVIRRCMVCVMVDLIISGSSSFPRRREPIACMRAMDSRLRGNDGVVSFVGRREAVFAGSGFGARQAEQQALRTVAQRIGGALDRAQRGARLVGQRHHVRQGLQFEVAGHAF